MIEQVLVSEALNSNPVLPPKKYALCSSVCNRKQNKTKNIEVTTNLGMNEL
jgi:hypothetical protein